MQHTDKASKYFTWGEMTRLPSWGAYHEPSEEEVANLTRLALAMDQVRDFFDRPLNVLCAIRPAWVNAPGSQYNGKNYNGLIGGAPGSYHIKGLAMDFTVSGISCEEVRHLLKDELERMGLRMENKAGAGWVHCDLGKVVSGRFFRP